MTSQFDMLSAITGNPDVMRGIQLGTLITARLLPVFAFTPVFGGQRLPPGLRFGLVFVFVAGLMFAMFPAAPEAQPEAVFLALIAKEILIGLTLALFILVMFHGFTACGTLIDRARGADSAQIADPYTNQQQTILSVFYLQTAVVLFLTIGGHRVLLAALGDSFLALPPFSAIPPRWVSLSMSAVLINLVSSLFTAALSLAAPVVIVIFLLDVVLGLINRVAPQVQVLFLGLSIKGTLAVLVVFVTLGLSLHQWGEEFAAGMSRLLRVFQ